MSDLVATMVWERVFTLLCCNSILAHPFSLSMKANKASLPLISGSLISGSWNSWQCILPPYEWGDVTLSCLILGILWVELLFDLRHKVPLSIDVGAPMPYIIAPLPLPCHCNTYIHYCCAYLSGVIQPPCAWSISQCHKGSYQCLWQLTSWHRPSALACPPLCLGNGLSLFHVSPTCSKLTLEFTHLKPQCFNHGF